MSTGTSDDSDETLMGLAAGGEARAFALLIARHEAAMRRFCGCLLRSTSQARDATQQTFLQLWQARKQYEPGKSVQAFVYTIARNVCRSMQRRQQVARLFLMGRAHDEATETAPQAVENIARDDATRTLRAALDRLPARFKEPLILRYFEGMDYDAIAQVLGRTPSAARSRVFYGLKALARHLPEDMNPWT